MPLPYRPRIIYGATNAVLSLSAYPWEVEDEAVGGHSVASSGEEEAFLVREDSLFRLRWRFDEQEWEDVVKPALRWARQSAQPITIWLDQDVADTAVEVLLVDPVAGERVRPERTTYPWVLELELVVRTVADGAWPVLWGDES
jgi:hypothetical protein